MLRVVSRAEPFWGWLHSFVSQVPVLAPRRVDNLSHNFQGKFEAAGGMKLGRGSGIDI